MDASADPRPHAAPRTRRAASHSVRAATLLLAGLLATSLAMTWLTQARLRGVLETSLHGVRVGVGTAEAPPGLAAPNDAAPNPNDAAPNDADAASNDGAPARPPAAEPLAAPPRWWFPPASVRAGNPLAQRWPWTWRMDTSETETVADLFPCLDMDCDGRRGPRLSSACHGSALVRRAECRWACSAGDELPAPPCSWINATSSAHTEPNGVRDSAKCLSCMATAPRDDLERVFCRPAPRVDPRPTLHARPLLSFADYLRSSAASLAAKRRTRILLFGDSTMRDMFHEVTRCQATAYNEFEAVPGTHLETVFPGQLPCMGNALHLSAMFSRTLRDNVTSRELVVDYAMAFHAASMDEDGVAALCAGHELVVINWGLHYPKQAAEYRQDMNTTLRGLLRCPQAKKLFASHPAQHFDTPLGWFTRTREFSRECVPLVGKVDFDAEFEDVDVWTRAVRDVAAALGVYLAPPLHLWGLRDPELERRLREPGGEGRVLRFVPHMDWTFLMHAFHTKKLGDCTHYQYRRHINSVVWDAVAHALLEGHDDRAARGRPLGTDRVGDALERAVMENARELPLSAPFEASAAALGRLLAANASNPACGGAGPAPPRAAVYHARPFSRWSHELQARGSCVAERARWYEGG